MNIWAVVAVAVVNLIYVFIVTVLVDRKLSRLKLEMSLFQDAEEYANRRLRRLEELMLPLERPPA